MTVTWKQASIASQRRCDPLLWQQRESRLHDNAETQLLDSVLSRRYEKNYLMKIAGRLQMSKNGRNNE
jgi:hypothetical protein